MWSAATSEDAAFLSAAEAGRRIEAGILSPVTLVDRVLDRIAALNGRLHSYITVVAEQARNEAARAAAEIAGGRRRGPLHGIPFAVIHEADATARPHLMGRALRTKMMAGATVRAADYLAALRQRRLLAAGIEALFANVDVLLLPGTQAVAPPLARESDVVDFTRRSWMAPFSLSGHPALSFPAGFRADGMPRNVQLATRWFDEATLLRCAAVLETASPWPARRPALQLEIAA